MKKLASALLPVLLAGNLACKKEAPAPTPPPPMTTAPAPTPVSISLVTLGNAIGADKRVTAPSEAFGPKDTIYASVETTGAGPARIRALWSFVKGDKTAKVDETTIEFESTRPAVNMFHVAKPGGWPKGDYKVEVFLGDAPTPAATRTFKVS
jgi:hypothetical protein